MKQAKRLLLSVIAAILCLTFSAAGQTKNKEDAASPSSCLHDNALNLIHQQIDASHTFADAVERITVLLRAADLQIWLALTRLEKQIQQSLPDLAPATEQAKASSFSVQSQKSQSSVTNTISQQERPKKTF